MMQIGKNTSYHISFFLHEQQDIFLFGKIYFFFFFDLSFSLNLENEG